MKPLAARTAVVATALSAVLALCAPGQALADTPLDVAPALAPAQETAGAVTQSVTLQATALVPKTAESRAPAPVREAVTPDAERAQPVRPLAAPRRYTRPLAKTGLASAPTRTDSRGAAGNARRPHRTKSLRAAASRPQHTGAGGSPSGTIPAPAPDQKQQDPPGVAGAAAAPSAPLGTFFTVLLIVTVAASFPSLLRPLEVVTFRRPAFASPVERPG